jgi:hypothetical protein
MDRNIYNGVRTDQQNRNHSRFWADLGERVRPHPRRSKQRQAHTVSTKRGAIVVSVCSAISCIFTQRSTKSEFVTFGLTVHCGLLHFGAFVQVALSGVRSNHLSYRPTA